MRRIIKRFKSGNKSAAAAAKPVEESFDDLLDVETEAEAAAREAAETAAREKADAEAREEADAVARAEAETAEKEQTILDAVRDAAKVAPVADRKPRLMVAGEFSAGKTHLINGLLGEKVLPSNVTATALPPIWLISGRKAMQAVDLEGKARPISSLEEVAVEDTHYVVLSHPAPLLKSFDIIDTPGNSDPNIPSESWERMLDYADAVIWCTNATQAWRQSEKSVWNEMPARLLEKATILITHADRITDQRSAERVERRVKREAGKYFASFLMASLLRVDDLARIRGHLEELTGAMETRDGAPCDIVKAFAAAHVQTGNAAFDDGAVAPAVAPKRVNSGKVGKAKAGDATPDTDGAAEAPSAEVHFFVPPSAEDTAPTSAGPSDARTLWARLSEDLDRTDAKAVLACVEELLAALEEDDDTTPRTPGLTSEAKDAAPGLVRTAMSRRKS